MAQVLMRLHTQEASLSIGSLVTVCSQHYSLGVDSSFLIGMDSDRNHSQARESASYYWLLAEHLVLAFKTQVSCMEFR